MKLRTSFFDKTVFRKDIIRGGADEVAEKVAAVNPAYYDVLPLSLEEIFIYELGGVNYEVKSIIL